MGQGPVVSSGYGVWGGGGGRGAERDGLSRSASLFLVDLAAAPITHDLPAAPSHAASPHLHRSLYTLRLIVSRLSLKRSRSRGAGLKGEGGEMHGAGERGQGGRGERAEARVGQGGQGGQEGQAGQGGQECRCERLPFRESKLTRLLRGALDGSGKVPNPKP